MEIEATLDEAHDALDRGQAAKALETYERVLSALAREPARAVEQLLVSAMVGKRDALDGMGRAVDAVLVDDALSARVDAGDEFVRSHAAYAALHALKFRVAHAKGSEVVQLAAAFQKTLELIPYPEVRVCLIEGLNHCADCLLDRDPDLAWRILQDTLALFADDDGAEITKHRDWTRAQQASLARSWSTFLKICWAVCVAVVAGGIVLARRRRNRLGNWHRGHGRRAAK